MIILDKIKEFYQDNKKQFIIGSVIFYLIGSIIAAFLSYRCNYNHYFGKNSTLVYTAISAIFSWIYLIGYLIFKLGTCNC